MHLKEASTRLHGCEQEGYRYWCMLDSSSVAFSDHMVKFTRFSDEKLFSIAVPVKRQTTISTSPQPVKRGISMWCDSSDKTRSNCSKSVVVSVAMSSLCASNIHVLEPPAVKSNEAYYNNVILRQLLLPDICASSGSWTVPHHIAPKT